MNREELLQVLPHRGAMLLVEDILEIEKDRSVLAYKRLREDEFWADGHFPGHPVFPGVLQIELMAQASLFLHYDGRQLARVRPVLAKVNQMTFLRPLVPGDALYVSVKLVSEGAGFEKAEARIALDPEFRQLAAKGTLTCCLSEEPTKQKE